MVDFVVEDGTGMPDATSLVALDWADSHLAATGYAPTWPDFSDDRRKELLVSATGIVSNSFSFYGTLISESQSLPFGRKNLKDREGRTIIGVPPIVRNAVSELGFHISENNYMEDSELATLEKIRVGPISLEVSELASMTKVMPDSIIRALSEYGSYRFGRNRMRRLIAG